MTPPANGQPYVAYDIPQLPPAHIEAPVSANCRFIIEGHEVQVTVRSGVTPQEVEMVMGTMAGLIRAYASPAPAVPPVSPPPQQAAVQALPEPSEAVPYCFEHGQRFTRHEKDGELWYSHKLQNPVPGGKTWCRYPTPPQV